MNKKCKRICFANVVSSLNELNQVESKLGTSLCLTQQIIFSYKSYLDFFQKKLFVFFKIKVPNLDLHMNGEKTCSKDEKKRSNLKFIF